MIHDRRVLKLKEIPSHEIVNNSGLDIEAIKRAFPNYSKFMRSLNVNDVYAIPYYDNDTCNYLMNNSNAMSTRIRQKAEENHTKYKGLNNYRVDCSRCLRTMTFFIKRVS